MYQIEDKLLDTLNKINFIFKNKDLNTECVKNYKEFSLLGENFGPFELGKKYKLKFFVALPFIEHNILKILPSEKCDNVDVQRYAIAERDEQRLVQQNNEFFLTKIKESKRILEKDLKDGIKTDLDLDRFNSYFSNIIDGRLLKILRLSKADLTMEDDARLTSSEKVLFKKLYELIKTWRNYFLEH